MFLLNNKIELWKKSTKEGDSPVFYRIKYIKSKIFYEKKCLNIAIPLAKL